MKMEMKSARSAIKLSIALTALSLLFCGNPSNSSLFRMYTQSDPGKLDPFYSTDVVSGRILAMICNGLFAVDERGVLIRDLAEWHDFDGTTLRVRIWPKVYFHNGRECTADDVIFSLNRVRLGENPTSPRKWVFSSVSSIEKADRYSLVIRLARRHATFPFLLTTPAGFITAPESDFTSGSIIGTGPFKLTEWKQDERIVLLRHNEYFKGRPKIRGVEYRIIPEDLMARFEFTSGNLDYFELPLLGKAFQSEISYTFIDMPETGVHYIAMNNRRFPFTEKPFRRALNMAINKQEIIHALFDSRFAIAHGPVPQTLSGYHSKSLPVMEYNPLFAKRIFAEMGIGQKRLTLLVKADYQYELVSRMIQHFLVDAGLSVSVQTLEWSALKSRVLRGDFDMAYFTWYGDYPEPENFLVPLFHSRNAGMGGNRAFFAHEKVDRLLEESMQTVDTQKRFDIYRRTEGIIRDEAPWIFLWTSVKRVALSKRVRGFTAYPAFTAFKGESLYFE